VRPEAISSNTFFNNGLVAHCTVDDQASIIASATLESALWTSRCRRQIDRVQNRRKHGARFLTKKPLGCCRSVRTRQEEVVNRGQVGPRTRQIKPSKLVIAQRQVPVSPFNLGT
jgi:hypothetical protein